jgi:4,5-dihydroxyphthalate decarboxylase
MMDDSTSGTSRREFVKSAAVAAGAAGVLGACGNAPPGSEERSDEQSQGLPITVAGYTYDRVQPLIDGRVRIDGCSLTFEKGGISDLNTHVFSGLQTIEVTEIGLHPYMLAVANDGFRGYSLLPVFPLRTFRHKSVFIRTDRGIEGPEDLRGKTIATPGYSSSSLTWIRGMLEDEYGITPQDVTWVVSKKDSSANVSGSVSKQENVIPEGIEVVEGPPGLDESDLLERGEVDALFHAIEPRAFVQRDPTVARLFPDSRQAERAYFAKTGIFPIMHAVAVRDEAIDENPWILEAVFNAYSRAKKMNDEYLRKLGWAMVSLPWFGQELEETRDLMGDNFWPYGIEPNRKTLDTLFRYSHEQGLASRRLTIEELFHPSSLEFAEELT